MQSTGNVKQQVIKIIFCTSYLPKRNAYLNFEIITLIDLRPWNTLISYLFYVNPTFYTLVFTR